MATRALIGIKKDKVEYYLKDSEGYPSGLGLKIYKEIRNRTDRELKDFKQEIEKGAFFGAKHITNIVRSINFLFHEYVYIIDFKKKTWSIYRTLFLGDYKGNKEIKDVNKWDYSNGKLNPILKDIPFNQELMFAVVEEYGYEEVILVKNVEENVSYKIIYDGKRYYFYSKSEDMILGIEKSRRELLVKVALQEI